MLTATNTLADSGKSKVVVGKTVLIYTVHKNKKHENDLVQLFGRPFFIKNAIPVRLLPISRHYFFNGWLKQAAFVFIILE
jgi:hypothetical protein